MGPARRRAGGSGVELTLGFGASDVSRPDKEGGIPASRFDPCAPQSRGGSGQSGWSRPPLGTAFQPVCRPAAWASSSCPHQGLLSLPPRSFLW